MSNFALTARAGVYHWYFSHVPAHGDDPLEALLLGKTKCGHRVVRVVGEAEPGLLADILNGLYCGNCWSRDTDAAKRIEEIRAAQDEPA